MGRYRNDTQARYRNVCIGWSRQQKERNNLLIPDGLQLQQVLQLPTTMMSGRSNKDEMNAGASVGASFKEQHGREQDLSLRQARPTSTSRSPNDMKKERASPAYPPAWP